MLFLLFIPHFFLPLRQNSTRKKKMGIQRNKTPEPHWEPDDYARINKDDIFSDENWKRTISWELLLEQVKKTENACQPIDQYIYPSRLFSAYIDILEANLHVLDDLFYFQTGIRIGNVDDSVSLFLDLASLRFWNMNCYKEIELMYEGLNRIENHLIDCLKQKSIKEIADEILKNNKYISELKKIESTTYDYDYDKKSAYSYACDAYRESNTDKNALADQIMNILWVLEKYKNIRMIINPNAMHFNFESLLTSFCQSEKGRNFIKPWRRDFDGSRDSLIVKMEKDPELGPWVNRYIHLREDKDVTTQLFYDDDWLIKNKEEIFNTYNWIHILTIAAVLREYDEQQESVIDASDEDAPLLMKLYLYFKDEDTAKRFLNSAQQMNDKEIITLVKKYRDGGLCTDTSKKLWKVLHDAKLYKSLYTNWNAQLNRR